MVHRPNETIKEKMKGNRMEPKYWSSTSREHFSFFFVEKVKDISLQRSRFIHFSSPFCQLDRTPPPLYSEATPAPPLIGGRSGKSVFRPQGCVLGFDKKAQEGGATFFFRRPKSICSATYGMCIEEHPTGKQGCTDRRSRRIGLLMFSSTVYDH